MSGDLTTVKKARALALAAAAALLLTSAAGMAQSVGTSFGAATLGVPSAAAPGVSGSGIPLGAMELGDTGLSPSPFGIDSTLTAPGPDLTGSLDAPPLGMPGAAGLGASPTGGLSPGVMGPQCAMPGTSFC